MTQDFSYTTTTGNPLAITLYGAESLGEGPAILYIHGFKGFKDWGFVPYAGNFFAQNGYSFFAFNFSHNGIGKNSEDIVELDKFEKNTFSLEVNEVLEMIHLITHTNFFGKDVHHKLGLIGHSRGGGVSLIAANRSDRVSALCTWASVSNFDRFSKEDRQKWRKRGYFEVVNSRNGQTLRMGLPILDDLEKNSRNKLNVLQAARTFRRPLLLLHGQEDETIPFFEAEHLNIYGDPNHTRMRIVPNGTHTFGAKHPFAGTTEPLTQVLNHTLEFFNQHLK
ncbi:MAG: prolyl oligopeptidase family serine peptidase [Bacteroidia bacterium]|nr:prolyl oligopeptidase family serine peptidase [Bacteroidia bacterium]